MTVSDLAAEYGVNRKTIRRRLDAAELADAERMRVRIERAVRPAGAYAGTSSRTGLSRRAVFEAHHEALELLARPALRALSLSDVRHFRHSDIPLRKTQ